MRYRVETVHVPGPSQGTQDSVALPRRRIVYVIKFAAARGGFDLMALTEESDRPGDLELAS